MRWFISVTCLAFALATAAIAQINFPSSKPTASIVTVLTDGLTEPNSPASQALNEISIALEKDSDLRVLNVNGYGGPTNVRDLLRLRGTDLAIVNSDVLSYLDLNKVLPEARQSVRLIVPLVHQGVFLFARQNVKSLEDLKGRKIGVSAKYPSRGITARTILGLLKINAEIIELADIDLAKRAGDFDAVLLYEQDLQSIRALGISPNTHHVLSIRAAGPLATAYPPKKLAKASLGGFFSEPSLETVQVSTLLIAFDWNAKQGRYVDVVKFVQKFFALLPQIRNQNPGSAFGKTDIKGDFPGWQRFGPSEALVAAAPALPAQAESKLPPALSSEQAATGEALRLLVVARPPLTNPQQPDGGVTLRLLTDALEASGNRSIVQWVDSERALLDGLLTANTGDIGVFWQSQNCDSSRDQSATEAAFCNGAVLSEPLMQVVIGVFTRVDTPLDSKSPGGPQGRTLCVPESQPIPQEVVTAIPWVQAAQVKVLRPKTLIDCLAAVDQRQADASISIEPEARFVIEKLKLSQSLQVSQRPGVTTRLHAVVAKANPRQGQLLQNINDAVAKFRVSNRYAAVMASHLGDLTGMPATAPLEFKVSMFKTSATGVGPFIGTISVRNTLAAAKSRRLLCRRIWPI